VKGSLQDARLYLVAGALIGARATSELIPELAAAGIDIVQLREKEMEALDLIRAGTAIAAACADAGIPFIVNDRADVALALQASGVHLGTNDLPTRIARTVLGAHTIVGRSTHSEDDIGHVLAHEDPDYAAVVPVHETPTKPGRPGTGVALIQHAARRFMSTSYGGERHHVERCAPVPWFAIGGIDGSNIESVLDAGARRVVVVRAITEAADPVAGAAVLKAKLLERPL